MTTRAEQWLTSPAPPCPDCKADMVKFVGIIGGRGLQHPQTSCSLSGVIFTDKQWANINKQEGSKP